LVVDDIRSNQLVLSKALASMGFVVTAADNGAEALRLLVQRQRACEAAGTLRSPLSGASPTEQTARSDPESAPRSLDAPRPPLPQFSIVLTDKSMPVMDGLDGTRRMRAAGYSGAIVGITGDATAEDRALFMRAGADEVLPKPVSKVELAAAIQRHLNV
jgi:CheY-like chemotaxis protein